MNASTQPLAWASLHPLSCTRGVITVTVPVARRRSFGHEVKVQKFDELHLDFSAGGTGFEQRGYGQEAVEGFECAGVGGAIEEACDEGQDSGGLYRRARRWVEEVKKELQRRDG